MIIEGTLFQPAELTYQPNKNPGHKPIPVCEMTIMADTIMHDKSGEFVSVPLKHRCLVTGPLAEVAADYCREPGMRIRANSKRMVGHTFTGAMAGVYNKTFFVDEVSYQRGMTWTTLSELAPATV